MRAAGSPAVAPSGGFSSGGGGDRGAVAGVGLLGLLFAMFDPFGFDEALALASAAPEPAFVEAGDGASRWWARRLAGALPSGGVSGGVETGMERRWAGGSGVRLAGG